MPRLPKNAQELLIDMDTAMAKNRGKGNHALDRLFWRSLHVRESVSGNRDPEKSFLCVFSVIIFGSQTTHGQPECHKRKSISQPLQLLLVNQDRDRAAPLQNSEPNPAVLYKLRQSVRILSARP